MIKRIKEKITTNNMVKNILILFKGNILASLIGLINMAILVKAIGLENNGILFMAQSYAMLFNTLFNFQSYNAIIMFVPRVIKQSKKKVVIYLKQGFCLDFTTAILGIIIAIICVIPVAKMMKWDVVVINCTFIYISIILFKTTGTMAGILRIYDKFKESVYINIIETISKLILFTIGLVIKANIYYFLIAEVICAAIGLIMYMWYTYIAIKEQELKFKNVKWKLDKEFFKFNLYSNLEVAVDLPLVHLTPFIMNSILGFSDIAVFKIIEKLGALIAKVTGPITQAIFPDLSKRIADNNIKGALNIHNKAKKIIGLLGTIMIIVATISSSLWIWILIPATYNNIMAMALYLVYIVFINMFMAIHPIFTFLGYIKKNIPIVVCANIFYLFILVLLANWIGIIGVIIAKIIQAIIVISCKELILKNNNYNMINI